MLLQEKVQGTTLGSFWGCSGWGESVVSYLYLLFVPVISSDASVPSLGFLKQKQCFREMPPVKIWILRGWRTWEVEPWWLKGKELLVLERPAGSGAPAKQTASCVYYQWAHPFIHVLMTLSTNDFEYHVCLEIGSGATVKRKIEFLTSRNSWSRVGGIQPSYPLSSPSPPAFNLSQHQGLVQWISSSHQMAKVLEFQL